MEPFIYSHAYPNQRFIQNLQRTGHLPTPQELEMMKKDLAFKETEMKKSETTASGLAGGKSLRRNG